jgi:hypothetical protein
VIGSMLLGFLLGALFAALVVWDYRRTQRSRDRPRMPESWVYCPFCPPRVMWSDGRRSLEPASVAGQSADGQSYTWAWCGRCGAHLHGGRWRRPMPSSPGYRDATQTQAPIEDRKILRALPGSPTGWTELSP